MPQCPICSKPMVQEQRSGVTIDVCHSHGLWLDRKELLSITEAERHEKGSFVWADILRREVNPPVDSGRALKCPHCEKTLAVEKYEGVHMDWCTEHGIWLDNDELEALLSNLRLNALYLGGVALRLFEGRY